MSLIINFKNIFNVLRDTIHEFNGKWKNLVLVYFYGVLSLSGNMLVHKLNQKKKKPKLYYNYINYIIMLNYKLYYDHYLNLALVNSINGSNRFIYDIFVYIQ